MLKINTHYQVIFFLGIFNFWILGLNTTCFGATQSQLSFPEDTSIQKKNSAALANLDAFVFQAKDSTRPTITDAFLVIKNGKIIFEKYANGFDKQKRHNAWSISKSVLNAVLGSAVKDGAISLDDSICAYVKTPKQNYCGITVASLANHSSGLDWSEDYEDSATPKDSAVLAMLYGEGIVDMEKFVLFKHAIAYPPNTHWNYSSGDSNLLAAVLKKAIEKKSDWTSYPWKKIFDPLQIESAIWERDAQSVIVGSSYLYISPRDLARFGLLYLNNGKINNKQILPEHWVTQSIKPAPSLLTTKQKLKIAEEPNSYGMHWWLNFPNSTQHLDSPWPNNPKDTYAALGHWGQYLFIIPSEQLIIVRLGNDRFEKLNKDTLLSLTRKFAL